MYTAGLVCLLSLFTLGRQLMALYLSSAAVVRALEQGLIGAAREALLYERTYSLLFEGGHRWVDYRRFGMLAQLKTRATVRVDGLASGIKPEDCVHDLRDVTELLCSTTPLHASPRIAKWGAPEPTVV